jgi:hypothetical protein
MCAGREEMLEVAAEFHLKQDWPQFAEVTDLLMDPRIGMTPEEIMQEVRAINNPTPHHQRLSDTKIYIRAPVAATPI